MSRPDKLFIKHGILYESWVRNDHADENTPVPPRQSFSIRRSGRYVRLQGPITEPLNFAEMQVFSGGVNVALNKVTRQSSNVNATPEGRSSLAVDGNTDGNYLNGSVIHTVDGFAAMEPWWEVDLGSVFSIDSIVVWNRTDGPWGARLKGAYLFVSNNAFSSNTLWGSIKQAGVSHYIQPASAGIHKVVPKAAELSYANMIPTYYEVPLYNYTIHQEDPNLRWSIAKGGSRSNQFGGIGLLDRGPTPFEQSNGFLNSIQVANLDKLVSICMGDEEGYSESNNAKMAGWYNVIKSKYPNVLCHNNQNGHHWSDEQLETHMRVAQPDLLAFDWYYFWGFGGGPGPGNSYPQLHADIQRYRRIALKGHDGTGTAPVPFGAYTQAFRGQNNRYYPSESQTNMQAFAYLTAGAKWVNAFLYRDMFWDEAASRLLPQYYQFANVGKQIANLSPHLSRLVTSDLRLIPGQNSGGTNAKPGNIGAWDTTADPYVKSISATNLVSSTNNGLPGDVLIGYFKPVQGLDNTPGITMAPVQGMNVRYFMLLNALIQENGCCHDLGTPELSADTIKGRAELARQRITLNIDFGNRPADTLYRVRRSDGVVERINLTPVGGSQYVFSDTLGGGLADLFYWKNAGTTASATNAVAFLSHEARIVAGNIPVLNGASKFTIESWVKFDDISNWPTVISKETASNNRIILQTNSGRWYAAIGSNGSNNYGYSAAGTVTAGQWYHVAVVYDGGQGINENKLKLFVNGAQLPLSFVGTIPATTSSSNTASLLVGNTNALNTTNAMKGRVDEVRIWKTALSETIIREWKDKRLGACHPDFSNLSLYWQLDDVSSGVVAKASLGTAYTGALYVGAYVSSNQATGTSGCAAGNGAKKMLSSNTLIDKEGTGSLFKSRIYPNPLQEEVLQVELESDKVEQATFVIYNLAGQVVYSHSRILQNGYQKLSLEPGDLPAGVYVLYIKATKRQAQHKFVKM